ncbi:MAG: hypothetical protein HQK68_12040 [Desulfamplus sp.]|nr:hypothetical protein [Desulfamplus sp.]
MNTKSKKDYSIFLMVIATCILLNLSKIAYSQDSGMFGSQKSSDELFIQANLLKKDKDGWICLDINIKNSASKLLKDAILRVAPAAMNNSKFDFNILKAKSESGKEQIAFYKEDGVSIKPKSDINKKICLLFPADASLEQFLIFIFIEGKIGDKPIMLRKIISLQNNSANQESPKG